MTNTDGETHKQTDRHKQQDTNKQTQTHKHADTDRQTQASKYYRQMQANIHMKETQADREK